MSERLDTLGIREKFAQWNTSTYPLQIKWAECLAYYSGKNYYTYSEAVRGFIPPSQTNNRIRMTTNQVLSIILTWESMLRRAVPEPYVRPVTNEPNDADDAVTTKAYLDYFRRITHNDELTRELRFMLMLYGSAYRKARWDDGAIGMVADADGKMSQAVTGEVAQHIGSPFDLAIEPGAMSIHRARWVIEHTVRSSQEVEEMYGVEVPEESVPMNFTHWLSQSGREARYVRMGVSVKEYWERPCKKYPNGRFAVTCNDREIPINEHGDTVTDLPYFEQTNGAVVFPFAWYPLIPSLTSCYGMTAIEHILSHNRVMDWWFSTRLESAALTAFPKMVKPSTVPEFKLTREAGQVINGGPNGAIPQWIPAPQLGGDVLALGGDVKSDMKGLTGSMDITETAQSGVGTARGQLAQFQQNASRTSTVSDALVHGDREFYRIVAELAKANKTYNQMIPIVGEDNEISLYAFNGARITTTDIDIVEGSAAPKDEYAEMQMLSEMAQYKMPEYPELWQRVLRSGIFPSLKESAQSKRARSQLREIRRGKPIFVTVHDDHPVYIATAKEWVMGNWSTPWMTDQMKNEVYWNIQAHSAAMAGDTSVFDPLTGIETPNWRAAKIAEAEGAGAMPPMGAGAPRMAMPEAEPMGAPKGMSQDLSMKDFGFGGMPNPLGIPQNQVPPS